MTRLAVVAALTPQLISGQSCVTGRVVSAANGVPIANAAISAAWIPSGEQMPKHSSDVTSDSLGHYRLCLTSDASVLIQAFAGTTGAYLPLVTPNGDTTIADLRMPAEGDTGLAIVAGHVVSETGEPVEGATVTILGGLAQAPTARDGTYGLRAPEGTQVLIVRRIGLGAAVVSVNLFETRPRLVNVTMQRLPPTLPVVSVVADRMRLKSVYAAIGLTRRELDGHGHFLNYDDIENRQAVETVDLLTGMPGIRFQYDQNGVKRVLTSRVMPQRDKSAYQDCTAYIVDGTLLGNGHSVYAFDAQNKTQPRGNEDETALPRPGDLIAVEVYQPGEPAPVQSPSVDRCVKVVLWTKAMLGTP